MRINDPAFKIAVLGLLLTIAGLVYHFGETMATIQVTQQMIVQRLDNNSQAIKMHESAIRDIQVNDGRMLQFIADVHK